MTESTISCAWAIFAFNRVSDYANGAHACANGFGHGLKGGGEREEKKRKENAHRFFSNPPVHYARPRVERVLTNRYFLCT